MAATASQQDRKGFYSVKFTDTELKTSAVLAESSSVYFLIHFYKLSLNYNKTYKFFKVLSYNGFFNS